MAETVNQRLARAQASGDPNELRSALQDAKAAGADSAYVDAAMAELDRLEAERAAAAGPPAGGPPEEEEAPAMTPEQAAELRARAEAFKKQGNERLKVNTKSAAREALEFFTQGLEVHCSDLVLNAQLYSNRGHVRLLLRQFVEVVDDCRKAIAMDPKNIKAYWRAAKASVQLDLCRNGLDFCERGLEQAPQDADLAKLRDQCAERLSVQQQRRSQLAAKGPSAASTAGANEFSADEAMALQDKVNGFADQLGALGMSISQKQRTRMSASLTQNSLQETPVEAPLYQGVGRCFLRQERSEVEKALTGTLASLDAELPKLTTAYQELEKRRQGAEQELQEMVQSFRKQSEAGAARTA